MVKKILKKYDGLAFLCGSIKEFTDCYEFVLENTISPNTITKKIKKENKKFMTKYHISKINGACYFILTKDFQKKNNNYYIIDVKNHGDFYNNSEWIKYKIINFSKISRKNKLKKLKNKINAKT